MPRRGARRKPRQARSQATVDAILEATAQLLVRDGPRTTTNHIAERAGVSIGSLYQYFPNKRALYVALTERHIDLLRGAMAEAYRQMLESPHGPFEGIVHLVLDVERANLELSHVLHGLAWHYPEVATRLAEMRHEQAEIAAVVQRQLSPAGDPEVQGMITRMAMRALTGVMQHTLAEEPQLLNDPRFTEFMSRLIAVFREMTLATAPSVDEPPAG